jgi:hypothetical protein
MDENKLKAHLKYLKGRSTILPGSIRHSTLPPALLAKIQRLWQSIGKAFYGAGGTLELWEVEFMRNENPEMEVQVWQLIEQATKHYLADHPTANLTATVGRICGCSMGFHIPGYQPYWEAVVEEVELPR